MEFLPSASPLLEDFGQKVDLTRRIREVLLNYPEGTTVLKELIQNADDAGATKVCLCLDRRIHGSESLLSDKLSQWQGPALLAYNNGEFTEDDFVSISRIGGSTKHSQAWKTGRFGVGFNSVYHLTDLPSFVSSKYVVLFDPQGMYLPNVSMANPGKRIDYVASSALELYRDQFLPYCAFGCDMKSAFSGTLFRFPLRSANQGANSKLSKQSYMEDDISSLFDQLYEEGVLTLLFLKTVLCVEMYIWEVGELEPRKIYSCMVNSSNDQTIWHRQTVLRLSKSHDSSEQVTDGFSLDVVSEATSQIHSQKRVDSFYIVQTMASSTSRIASFAAAASKDFDMHLLPWAAVAAHITNDSSHDNDNKLGRAFCFLPLPVRTGMDVHINAYFEVSSNRRGIWYGADMDRSGKVRSLWNRLLLEDVVAPSFVQLLLQVRSLLGPTESYYSIWPSGSFEEPWSILVEHIYRKTSDVPVLYSDVEGGKWVPPTEAFLHDEEFFQSKELGEALVQIGMPVVHLPRGLSEMLLKSVWGFQQKSVTPDSVRNYLRAVRGITTLNRSYKLVLLEYCLDDLIDDDVGIYAQDLPLLPLASGNFGLLSGASKDNLYFICNELEYLLLQQISDRIIDQNITSTLFSRLSAVAKASSTNLVVFNVNHLLEFFPKFVPVHWKYESEVLWDPVSNASHPTSEWLVLFWRYLRDQCEKLSLFGDWPVLPSLSGHLHRPSTQSRMLSVVELPENLRGILVNLGCKILHSSYGIEHPDLCHYVNQADAAGVLESIFDVAASSGGIAQVFHLITSKDRDELRQFLLYPKWYIGPMADSDIMKCKKLPIYRVYGGDEYHDIFQNSGAEDLQKYLPPQNVPECLLSSAFICSLSTNEEEILNKYYGVERMRKARFYKQCAFNQVSELQPEFRDNIMLSILQELPQLSVEDSSFKESLKKLKFVPTSSGLLKSPEVLYDPRNEELYDLLEDSDNFPSGVFEDSVILDMLQSLGLKTSVSLETIVQSARQVERYMNEDPQKACTRGKVLLSYLEINASKWLPNPPSDGQATFNNFLTRAAKAFKPRHIKSEIEKFWNDLRMVSWCPVMVSSPYEALPWPVVSSVVAPPKVVRLYADLWIVSASMRILDGECSSTALSYQLGWSAPPGGSVISAQLLELGKNNEIVTDQLLRRELAVAMPRIYTILMGMIGSEEMDIVKAVLEGSRWIWVGDGFAKSDEVFLEGPLHLAPYIRVIPIDLAVFRDLFLELSIREYMKPGDYADILGRMAVKKESMPLDTQEIRAATLIAQHLAEVQFHSKNIQIYLPDATGRMTPASDLVYNDAPWLLGSDEFDNSHVNASTLALNAKRNLQKFIHGNISNDIAEKLGVRSLRRILLAESADSMNLSLSDAAEAFGQHEALTTRLKHILEMYADGPGVLFELVQNAEDAKASEVIFLLDTTQYGTSSVLSLEMADWQGPALYCFNDSVFSPHDLYAISRIGQESKLEKPFAIGRFGLGFNSVYHFTDIPTFVSGENIVIFDPHACNLPGISPSHPGLRIKFAGRRILDQFPDQFSPFLQFGCDLQNPFPGTLFRFPLRNANVASRSQIRKEVYEPEDVMKLFKSFSDVVSQTLIFLSNVKTISIFLKDGTSEEMRLLHRVHKEYVIDPTAKDSANKNLFDIMHSNQDIRDKDLLLSKLSKSVDGDLPSLCQKVVVRERGPSGEKSHHWITSECLNSGFLKNNPVDHNSKSNRYIPWACVASYLNSVDIDEASSNISHEEVVRPDISQTLYVSQQRKNFEGRAFCFLPLPICTGLPVHVNAYFELSSNRRDIWFGSDMSGGGKKRSDWNIHLLEDIAAPAYGHLLVKIASDIGPGDFFFSFWPTAIGIEPWASMVHKFYRFVADSSLCMLYTKARGGHWISAKQAIFPDFSFQKADELVEALAEAGLPVVAVPKSLVEKFMEICPSLHFLTPQLLRTLLIRRKRQFSDRNSMLVTLEYCLLDFGFPVPCDRLYGLPLLPLSNGLFTTFGDRKTGERVYITKGDEYGLLKDLLPHQLVDPEISDDLCCKLNMVAQSEGSNIYFLTCELLETLFVKLLPADWLQAKQVQWVPGFQGQPTMEWMKLFWSYLKISCDHLSIFSKWPILPVGKNHLLQLVENSNVIEDDGWSENMCTLLLKVGCLILRSDFPIQHPELGNYVQPPTASGLLSAFMAVAVSPENIPRIFDDASESELHELRSFVLQSKWFNDGSMVDMHIESIKWLPVFESFRSRKLVPLCNPIKWLKPSTIREDLLDDNFVRIVSEKEKAILKNHLEVREPSTTEFYKDYVLNHLSDFLSQQDLLLGIIKDIKLLIEDDTSIKEVLSSTAFVLARDGSLKQPSRLYDPRVSELEKVLHKEVFFPSEIFSDPETLDTLVVLGLQQNLGFMGLLDCARTVSLLEDMKDPDTVNYARRLMICLDVISFKLSNDGVDNSGKFRNVTSTDIFVSDDGVEEHTPEKSEKNFYDDVEIGSLASILVEHKPGEDFWSTLKSISWCPIYVNAPVPGLPLLMSDHLVAAPINVRPKSQMWLVSSKMHIIEVECHSVYLQSKLGWLDPLNLDILFTQLVCLSRSFTQLQLDSRVEPATLAALQDHIPLLYSELQDHIYTNEFMVLKSSLDGVSWVWIGDEFVKPNALAFDSPVRFSPYLYVVPSELSQFRDLLLSLGVKPSFDISDYFHVLQRLQIDAKGFPLSSDQLTFVGCILEAVADCCTDKPLFENSSTPLLIPDSSGLLKNAADLVYNDAPWIENIAIGKDFAHSMISNDLAEKLGVPSLRCMSLVHEEMTKDLPCMDYPKITELLDLYANSEFLLFDLLEFADTCKATKLHLIFDKREHPRQSLLQHNLGEFQGPALIAVLEGVGLNRDEMSILQYLPPWRLRGDTLNYGLGLLSCFSVCDLLSVISSDNLYIFDPKGIALSGSSGCSPVAKMFSLTGTGLTEKFRDQFSPMLIGQNMPWSGSEFTVIRMPLFPNCSGNEAECKENKIEQIFDKFMEHGSKVLLFLKSLLQVSLSTWDEGSLNQHLKYSVSVDSSHAITRNPFLEKKWRKFQLSRIFSNSSAAIKMHAIDVILYQEGSTFADRWLIALSLGSGQTRNMALDRRYLAYNLTPVAGVAIHISQNGQPVELTNLLRSVMCPLPLSGGMHIPANIIGCFLVRHNEGRYLFKYQNADATETRPDAGNILIEAWNRELMCCVRDAYIELVLEMQKLRKEPSSLYMDSSLCRAVSSVLNSYGDHYSFWPRSLGHAPSDHLVEDTLCLPTQVLKADWECVTDQVIRPFYARLIDLPVWQLYSGNLVKADEGMFLAQPGSGVGGNVLPATVCAFVKEHYPVFSVPWQLVTEIQAIGVTVRQIKPKMVRDLLRMSSTSIALHSVDTFVDVLEYCLSDIQLYGPSSSYTPNTLNDAVGVPVYRGDNEFESASSMSNSNWQRLRGINPSPHTQGGDALGMMTSLGKALFDFGRGVVEDIGKTGGPYANRNTGSGASIDSISRSGDWRLILMASELKGIPFPTASSHLSKLGGKEMWLGNKEQQILMTKLAARFIHPKVLERQVLADILYDQNIQNLLNLQKFSLRLLADHMKLLFHESWVSHVVGSNSTPWFSWESVRSSGDQIAPSPEWIRLFWKSLSGSSEDLSLFSDWPLIPAFIGRSVLCRVRARHLVFLPPKMTDSELSSYTLEEVANENNLIEFSSEFEFIRPHLLSYQVVQNKYPWLLTSLNQFNIPIFDTTFIECAEACNCLPIPGQSIGKIILSMLVAVRHSGYFPDLTCSLTSNHDELLTLFASDFCANGSTYATEEREILRDFPIYKTVVGSYTRLHNQELCLISASSFLKPQNACCFSYPTGSNENVLLQALGIPELHDKQIFVKFGLPGFGEKPDSEQEDILIYLFANWQDLQFDSSVLEALKEANFVRNADEFSAILSKPKDLFDPGDVLLASVFSGEREKFPGERFSTEGWLQILRKIGLRTASDAEVILECARKVESMGAESTKSNGDFDEFGSSISSTDEIPLELWSLAESVVKAIFSNFAVFYSNNFCNTLGKIACVPSEKGFPNIGGKRVLCSFSEAVLLKDWPLAWSSAPILSRQNVVPPEYSWGALHLKSPPAFQTVLKHLQEIGRSSGEDTLAHWPTASGIMTIEEACLEVLKYLEKTWGSLSSSDKVELQGVAFLPAANGTRLVTVNSLFARLTIELSPFAFELPAPYLPYVKILKEMGLQDLLSVAFAKGFLSNLQKACGYQRLNPNELRAVMEILHYIFNKSDEDNTQERSNWGLDAIVPDDGCRLVHANACVYIDSYGLHFVKYIDTSRLRLVHPDLSERICATLQIKKLSDVVTEELCCGEHMKILGQIGPVSLTAIKQKLLSKSFQSALLHVANSIKVGTPGLINISLEKIQTSVTSIAEKLQFVRCIHTRFLLLPKAVDITRVETESVVPEWEGESQHRAIYFIDQSKTHMLIAEPPSYMSVIDVIALVVSRVLGSSVPLPIGSLFICPEESETAIANVLKLCSEKKVTTDGGGTDGGSDFLGRTILAQDAMLVQLHPLRPFYSGELVAWRTQTGEKLKYGRVVENVRPSAGQALYRFKVETGPGVIEFLLSSHVFSFKGVSLHDEAGSSSNPRDGLDDHRVTGIQEEETGISGRGKSQTSQQQQANKELNLGRVSAMELVQAVQEMLSTAGISMDVEKQSLLQRTLILQEQLKESQVALLIEQEKSDIATKEADTAKAAWICRVCLSNEVDITIVPCGHVLCRRCSSAVSRCPFCRLQVSKTLKIFRP
ncbi:sacsin isoform X2 [Impatiens glandulifera]|uniref:sacsin isoform X2 n=1 Tax=Impatiens glandulifera TaxID=253017 RepID=UPI001FB19868|nr:sacsin isoform X2 [Impatiens glandulifera]